MNPVRAVKVRRDDVVSDVVDSPAPKGLVLLVGVLGFLVVVELGIAVAVTR